MKYLYVVLLIIVSVNINSQERRIGKSLYGVMLDLNEKLVFRDSESRVIDLSQTKGSPYFKEFFMSGIVYSKVTNENLGFQMRYNIYNDEIEVRKFDNNSIVSLQKDNNLSCKILNDKFIFLEYTDEDNNENKGYYQVLTEGKASLLIKYFCKYKPETTGSPPVYLVTPARFITQKVYYLLVDDKLILMPTKKKKFVNALGANSEKVSAYIKHNKLKISNERDLIRIVSYYNSLL